MEIDNNLYNDIVKEIDKQKGCAYQFKCNI